MRRITTRAAALRRDERGGMIIFGLFVFLLLLLAGGMAVDFMRTETARGRLQATLDGAVLAAADLDQDKDPVEVVRDYVAKAGLDPFLIDVDVTEIAGQRIVTASAKSDVTMHFMKMVGIDFLPAPARSTASEAVSNLDVSLVLDMSGSMEGDKLDQLQAAAKNFVGIVYDTMGAEKILLNVVPYATQVAAPAGLLDMLGAFLREHSYSNCVSFSAADFTETSILEAAALPQGGHFDPFYTWGPLRYDDVTFVCNPDPSTEVLTLASTQREIEDYIDGLVAEGNTSIDVGMKWGAALIDPDLGSTLNEFANGPSAAGINPVALWGDRSTDKVIVLMTDGKNTTEYRLPATLGTWSDVYIDDARDEFWVRQTDDRDADDDNRYSNDTWFWVDGRVAGRNNFWRRDNRFPHGGGRIEDNVRRLTYEELFSRVSVYYNAYYHHYLQNFDRTELDTWYWDFLDMSLSTSAKNARLEAICTAAKNQGVQVFTVGFEVEDDEAIIMEDCASSRAHFFRVSGGGDLTTAFESIARQITELRLTE
ncbi:hypothetical protein OG2516_06272 [Oceanicola granulosus HTCC2516]|uniref:Putative Flp pilus-assembly TadG-like N-terminal domain-containing protein n=2 Tax=Oceanicola granulosus TaxID=252302 RepID=Q2CDB0_OCEGH|nr:hypothetical protein OG2516_06272 [Oceanicola granulosus HTCC2516]